MAPRHPDIVGKLSYGVVLGWNAPITNEYTEIFRADDDGTGSPDTTTQRLLGTADAGIGQFIDALPATTAIRHYRIRHAKRNGVDPGSYSVWLRSLAVTISSGEFATLGDRSFSESLITGGGFENYTTDSASGAKYGHLFHASQTRATTGNLITIRAEVEAVHTTGTVALMGAIVGNAFVDTAGGTTTWARSVGGGGSLTAGTVTNYANFYAQAPASGGTNTNHYRFYGEAITQGTNRYGLYLGDVSGGTLNYVIYTNAGAIRLGDATTIVGLLTAQAGVTVSGGSISAPGIAATVGALTVSGAITYSLDPFDMIASTSDGADTNVLRLYGGGGSGATRGAGIQLIGNERAGGAGVAGSVYLDTGNVAGAQVHIRTANGAGLIEALTINADQSVTLVGPLTLGTGIASNALLQGSGNGNNGLIQLARLTGTSAAFGRFTNTSGDIFWGVDSSTGAALFTGGTAYAAFVGTLSNQALQLGTNGAIRLTIAAAGLATFSNDVTIGSLGRFDSTDTPSEGQLLVYKTGSINKWQAENIQFVRGSGDFKAALLSDGTAAAYILLDPGAGGAGAQNDPSTPTVTIGHLAFTLDIPSGYTKAANFRYFQWQMCTGAACAGFADLVNSTSRSIVHSRLTSGTVYRYRVRAVSRAGDVSAWATTGDNTAASQSDVQAFGGIIAGELATVDLTALAGDIGTIVAGQIRNNGNTAGVLVSGALPGTWTRYLDLTADAGDTMLKHDKLELKYDGTGKFSGQLDIMNAQNAQTLQDFHILFRDPDVTHGMTTQVETDVLGALGFVDTLSGGLNLMGFTERANQGVQLVAQVTDEATDPGAIYLEAWKKSGTSRTALGANGWLLGVSNGGTERLTIWGGGTITGSGQLRCKAYHNADQSVGPGATTVASWNSEVFDIGALHDTAANTSRISVPGNGAGIWLITAVLITTGNVGEPEYHIRKNATTRLASQVVYGNSSGSRMLTVIDVAADSDYYEVEIVTAPVTGATVLECGSQNDSSFMAVKLW